MPFDFSSRKGTIKNLYSNKFHIFHTPIRQDCSIYSASTQSLTAMPDNNTRRVNFALAQITTEQLDIFPDLIVEDKPVTLNAALDFGIDSRQNLLKVLFKNVFLQDETPFITIVTGCVFAIDPESWALFCSQQEGFFVLPKNFAGHLATLTASTSRGILHNKTENTPMNRFFIPANNIDEMIPENMALPLEPQP
jgi:hypothetical protein